MKQWEKIATLALPALVASAVVWQVVILWNLRVGYPFDLEWMEGGMLAHAWRLREGLDLYPQASREFIPYIYPAGYASLLAALSELVGLDYTLGRVISVAGTVAAAGAIVRIVREHAGDTFMGLAGAALFLGCYEFSGAFYDLARLDALNVGLLAWSVALGLEKRRGAIEASALLLAAAFLVKQQSALFGIPLALGVGMRDGWRAAGRYVLWSAVPALLITGFLQIRTDGRYLQYVIGVPASHGMKGDRGFPGTPRELAHALGIVLPVATIWLVGRTARVADHPRRLVIASVVAAAIAGVVTALLPQVSGTTRFATPLLSLVGSGCIGAGLVAGAVGMVQVYRGRLSWRVAVGVTLAGLAVVSSALMRAHVGGFLNVHMQMHWVVCLAAAIAFSRWLADTDNRRTWAFAGVLLAAQSGFHFLDLVTEDSLLPTAQDVATGEQVVAILAEQPGPVWSPFAPWLPVQAGHEPSFHLIALWDVDHRGSPMRDGARDVDAAIEQGWFATIVDGTRPLRHGVPEHYRGVQRLPTQGDVFTPKTGWPAKPSTIKHPEKQARTLRTP